MVAHSSTQETVLLPGWEQAETWEREIRAATGEPNPVVSNLKITRVHYLLGQALQEVVGVEAGANFHSWAVWGSRKAGATIRQEDLDSALRNATVVAGITGTIVGVVASIAVLAVTGWPWPLLALGLALGAGIGAWTGRLLAKWSRGKAAAEILAGNRIVLEDIGRVSARYIELFHRDRLAHPERLAAFVAELRPGPTENGGQEYLRTAFQQYDIARADPDFARRQQAAYFANCLVVLHEHIRLQPHIVKSMPFIVRKCVTERQMAFDVGANKLAVAHDVPPLEDAEFPPLLRTLSCAELDAFLHGPTGWAIAANALNGTRAEDWTKIRHRMGYIVQLFRSRHVDAQVCTSPYSESDLDGIVAGRLPAGRL